jgi:dimethylargininase
MIAFTRPVPDSVMDCELTHIARAPIDVANARRQHTEYQQALRSLGCEVRELPALHDHPDSVFIEDTALVFDECAVITRPGAESRRGETAGVAEALKPYRRLYHIEAPGTLDGGDVLRVGKRVYVGDSSPTRSRRTAIRWPAPRCATACTSRPR